MSDVPPVTETATGWNFATIWDEIARLAPGRAAIVQGDRILNWHQFETRSAQLAGYLAGIGLTKRAKIAVCLYNCPEFLETYYAAFKADVSPFNANYHYGPDELEQILTAGDAEAVLFDASLADKFATLRDRLPNVRAWICVGAEAPQWAAHHEQVVADGKALRRAAPYRADAQLLQFTGGTTGLPAGVVWRHGDLFAALGSGADPFAGCGSLDDSAELPDRIAATDAGVTLIAPPLMHATGLMSALMALASGRKVAFLPTRRFDAHLLWDEAERLLATRIAIVGGAFSVPMLDALDANPDRWDLSALELIGSSGAMWSIENKRGMLRHLPSVVLNDALSSSEAIGIGGSVASANDQVETARFTLGEHCAVFTEEGRRVVPGSGERGLVALGGPIPLGYYKNLDKTERAFRRFEGRRWSTPGDWAEVEADGVLKFVGRGSQCINSGGEKIFPEEVEEVLKLHPAVTDAAVIGMPDPRFGETVCAIVQCNGTLADAASLTAHVKQQLAAYKAPRSVLIVPDLERMPNGKLNYTMLKKRFNEVKRA